MLLLIATAYQNSYSKLCIPVEYKHGQKCWYDSAQFLSTQLDFLIAMAALTIPRSPFARQLIDWQAANVGKQRASLSYRLSRFVPKLIKFTMSLWSSSDVA